MSGLEEAQLALRCTPFHTRGASVTVTAICLGVEAMRNAVTQQLANAI